MKFQGEECILSMASYFNRDDVLLNGTLWVRASAGDSARYRQPWLRFTHTLPAVQTEDLRTWLRAVAAGKTVLPIDLPGPVRQLSQLDAPNPDEVSLVLHYHHTPEPLWWAWAITEPLEIRMDIPRSEFASLITVFDRVEWSFY